MAHVGNAYENVYQYLLHHVPPRRKDDPAIHESINAAIEFLRSLESERPDDALFAERRSEIAGDTRAFVKMIFNLGLFVWFAAKMAETLPPSKGYYRLLNTTPVSPWAKLFSNLAYRHGQLVAAEELMFGDVMRAIKYLGRHGRRPTIARSKISFLLEKARETSVLDRILPDGTDQINYVKLLETALNAGTSDQLIARCAQLTKYTEVKRGPKISAVSAVHQSLIEMSIDGKRSYTYNGVQDDFTDPLTSATRLEFDDPKFDPRPAVRRAMAKMKRQE